MGITAENLQAILAQMKAASAPQQPTMYGQPAGLKQVGNLELWDRPVLNNADGTKSTTRSISVGTDEGEVLIPTVVNGKALTPQQAIEHYRATGGHLGVFDTPKNADAYSIALHNEQAKRLGLTP